MIFDFEERPSDSPFVERIWCAQSERTGDFLSIAASQWEMVVSKYQGALTVTVRGPETKATSMQVTLVGSEFFGIIFRYGAFMPRFPVSSLVDGDLDLPNASGKSFWLSGSAWEFPNYQNADVFVERLRREGLLFHDPIVGRVLRGEPQELSRRSIQRRFLQSTGLTQGSIRKIERARSATRLLQEGVSILDTVELTGYSDQAHLTRALKYLIGKTPAQIIRKSEPEQMSLLFKTGPFS
ncbi:MAG TPA: helix-turn-helix domain-containing protein [Anaerolineales bacterium]|nr:helix-turn-helix domain-containing protein [Anaerolineales bacterium]